MSFNKESATPLKPNQPEVLPDTPRTPFRSDEVLLADELSNAAGLVGWPREPEHRDFERTAGLVAAAGYPSAEDLAGASAAGELNYIKLWRMDDRAGPDWREKC